MEVIALWGRHDSGKSATLLKLYSLLLQSGYKQVAGHHHLLSGGEDIYDVLTNGKQTIGIITRGDVGKWLEDDLKNLVKAGCVKTVCACRTRGYTNDAVEKYPQHTYVAKILESNPNRHAAVNQAQAYGLLSII